MATIRTADKQKFKVEVSAKKADEEIVRVGGRAIPIVDLKLAGKDEMVFINATHIVSIEDDE
jgi:fructose-specific component phosphotransferase system IIB-like protein